MTNNIFSQNLRKIRIANNYTQEQVARHLGVSSQSVSRWECGATYPDIRMLPDIAKLYGITIEDLYKEDPTICKNYAERLLMVYESTEEPKDFVNADKEFAKLIKENNCGIDDLYHYGILHQHMMNYCTKKMLALYDELLDGDCEENADSYEQIVLQKIKLLATIGRSKESISTYLDAWKQNSNEVGQWIFLIAAYHYAGEDELAYQYYNQALEKFADNMQLFILGEEICRSLKKYDEVVWCQERSNAIGSLDKKQILSEIR